MDPQIGWNARCRSIAGLRPALLLVIALCLSQTAVGAEIQLANPIKQHGSYACTGTVTLVSPTEIRIDGFSYDGTGPSTYLWLYTNHPGENGQTSSGAGLQLAELPQGQPINEQTRTITLPENESLVTSGTTRKYKGFGLWCTFGVDFCSVHIRDGLDFSDPETTVIATTTSAPTTTTAAAIPTTTTALSTTAPPTTAAATTAAATTAAATTAAASTAAATTAAATTAAATTAVATTPAVTTAAATTAAATTAAATTAAATTPLAGTTAVAATTAAATTAGVTTEAEATTDAASTAAPTFSATTSSAAPLPTSGLAASSSALMTQAATFSASAAASTPVPTTAQQSSPATVSTPIASTTETVASSAATPTASATPTGTTQVLSTTGAALPTSPPATASSTVPVSTRGATSAATEPPTSPSTAPSATVAVTSTSMPTTPRPSSTAPAMPQPVAAGALENWSASYPCSGSVVLLDDRRIQLVDFSYAGNGPATFFWLYANHPGTSGASSGAGQELPNELGVVGTKLRQYTTETIIVTIPAAADSLLLADGKTVRYQGFGLWCEAAGIDFCSLKLPATVDFFPTAPAPSTSAPPTSLPSSAPATTGPTGSAPSDAELVLPNCHELGDVARAFWAVTATDLVVEIQSVVPDGEYVAFGPSPNGFMLGSDVTVVGFNQGAAFAVDYFLRARSQCARGTAGNGACPDVESAGGVNSVTLVKAEFLDSTWIVRFKRPLAALDSMDLPITPGQAQKVAWSQGPLDVNSGFVQKHYITSNNLSLQFGRAAENTCRPLSTSGTLKPFSWPEMTIQPPDGTPATFHVKIGPSAGKRGYEGITGNFGWGIAYYINDLLIPRLILTRGVEYTFVVEAGNDPARQTEFHPIYITADEFGGYFQKDTAMRSQETVYAGLNASDAFVAGGRFCGYANAASDPTDFPTFNGYLNSLSLACRSGSAQTLTWTPDESTPDTVYYNCLQHKNLGWKISVVDSGITTTEEPVPGAGLLATAPGALTILTAGLAILQLLRQL